MLVQFIINMSTGVPSVLGLGAGGAFGTLIVSIVISVGLAEFFGRMCEAASPDEDKKAFNFDTHTYDSETNGKLRNSGKESEKKVTASKSSKGRVKA